MASLLQRSPQGLIETSLHCQGLGISHFLSLILLHLFLPPPSLLPFCLLSRLLLLEKHRFKTSLFPLILSQTRISEPHTSTPSTVPEHLSLPLLGSHKYIPHTPKNVVQLIGVEEVGRRNNRQCTLLLNFPAKGQEILCWCLKKKIGLKKGIVEKIKVLSICFWKWSGATKTRKHL